MFTRNNINKCERQNENDMYIQIFNLINRSHN